MNKINSAVKSDIIRYMKEDESKERCGLVFEAGGIQRFIPCKNTHNTPEVNFCIDAKDFVIASMSGDVIAVVHSHTEKGLLHLSAHDRFCQYNESISWALYHPSNSDVIEFEPVAR